MCPRTSQYPCSMHVQCMFNACSMHVIHLQYQVIHCNKLLRVQYLGQRFHTTPFNGSLLFGVFPCKHFINNESGVKLSNMGFSIFLIQPGNPLPLYCSMGRLYLWISNIYTKYRRLQGKTSDVYLVYLPLSNTRIAHIAFFIW